MNREIMQQAYDAMNDLEGHHPDIDKAMAALRQELAKPEQAEKQEPYPYVEVQIRVGDFRSKKAMTKFEFLNAPDPIEVLSLLADNCIQSLTKENQNEP
jgi:hypothetical protein